MYEDGFFMNIAPSPSFGGGLCRIVAELTGESMRKLKAKKSMTNQMR